MVFLVILIQKHANNYVFFFLFWETLQSEREVHTSRVPEDQKNKKKNSNEEEYETTAKRAKHEAEMLDYEMIDLGTPHKRDNLPSSAGSRKGGRSAD